MVGEISSADNTRKHSLLVTAGCPNFPFGDRSRREHVFCYRSKRKCYEDHNHLGPVARELIAARKSEACTMPMCFQEEIMTENGLPFSEQDEPITHVGTKSKAPDDSSALFPIKIHQCACATSNAYPCSGTFDASSGMRLTWSPELQRFPAYMPTLVIPQEGPLHLTACALHKLPAWIGM